MIDHQFPEHLEAASAQGLLGYAFERYSLDKLVFACSFGAEDVVLLDLFEELGCFPRVVSLDTGRLPQETHDLVDRVRAKYPRASIEVHHPDAAELKAMCAEHGQNLFYKDVAQRKLCCDVRKVRPLRRALAGAEAWIVGLRRAQSPDRSAVSKIQWDPAFGLVKLSPLADWTDDQVWQRIRERKIPYNQLHDMSFPSIGCAPCTRAVKPGEDARAGRWWWEQPSAAKECGLHTHGKN